ncbi:MAG: Ig-like domain-containing protein, partial [Gemmatimonadota bacterium]
QPRDAQQGGDHREEGGGATNGKSTNSTVVSVNSRGVALGRAGGTAKIVVTASKHTDSIAVTVVAKTTTAIASIGVTAGATSIAAGGTTTVTAVARDANGTVVPGVTFTFASSNTAVATVTSAGVVTGVSGGTATISAAAGGVKGQVSLSVQSVVVSQPTSAFALPTPPQLLSVQYPSVTGKSWLVKAGDNLQTVLNQAQRGDEIVLPAGVTFKGTFILPAKTGTAANGWILIRSDRQSSLPPRGTRVTPAYASLMPKIMADAVSPALMTAAATSGWWITGVEFVVDPALTKIHYGLVTLGEGSTKQRTLTSVPNDLVLDRTYIHGSPRSELIRCIALNSGRTVIEDSYLVECHAKGFDSQAIVGWNGPGSFKIVNNTLAGAGENIMFGGGDPGIPNLIPSDIEIRRNYIYTPAGWKGVWTKKNLFETKNVRRVLIEGNVFDGSWQDGQVGYAFVLKVANQSGYCTWCTATDITIRNNIIRNAGAGIGITGREGSNSYPIGGLLNRLLVEQNIVENINTGIYTGDGRLVSIMQNAQNVTIRSNTMTAPGTLYQYVNVGSLPAATNFAFENNVVSYGKYGFFSSWYGIGENSLKAFSGTVAWKNVVMIGSPTSGYPNGTFVSSLSAAQSTGRGASLSGVAAATQGVIIP